MSRLDSNESNNTNEGSEYYLSVSESSTRNQPSKSESISLSTRARSTTEIEVLNDGNNSNIRSIILSERIVNSFNKDMILTKRLDLFMMLLMTKISLLWMII